MRENGKAQPELGRTGGPGCTPEELLPTCRCGGIGHEFNGSWALNPESVCNEESGHVCKKQSRFLANGCKGQKKGVALPLLQFPGAFVELM